MIKHNNIIINHVKTHVNSFSNYNIELSDTIEFNTFCEKHHGGDEFWGVKCISCYCASKLKEEYPGYKCTPIIKNIENNMFVVWIDVDSGFHNELLKIKRTNTLN